MEIIPLPLRQPLSYASTREQYLQTMLQTIREHGTNKLYLEAANIAAAQAEQHNARIVQQVSELLRLDRDTDGSVSEQEVKAFVSNEAPASQDAGTFMRYDLNKDGRIDYQEMRTVSDTDDHDHSSMPSLKALLALDPDKDGKLTAEELEGLANDAFAMVDQDKDGMLSDNERAALNSPSLVAAVDTHAPLPAKLIDSLTEGTELHVVGVYEAAKRDASGVGNVEIRIERTDQPIVLGLGSYESIDWKLSLARGVKLKAVVLSSYTPSQVVNLPKGVPIYTKDVDIGYEPTMDQLRALETVLASKGAHLASWQGAYTGTSFSLTNDFVNQPQKAYHWPSTHGLPDNTEIQVVRIKRGQSLSPDNYPTLSVGAEMSRGSQLGQAVDIELKETSKPVLLVLSAPEAVLWRLKDPNAANLAGVVLAGPSLQYLDGSFAKPVVMWPTEEAGLYESAGYKRLAKRVKDSFKVDITGYTGANIVRGPVVVAGGIHFPNAEDAALQKGTIDIPADAKQWDKSGEYVYKLPASCRALHAVGWGAGGAGGSWTSSTNYGGGGAFVSSILRNVDGKTLKIIVGGGGKVGTHLSNENGNRVLPAIGKGGYPDGGNGGTGYDATGGGGGGASRILVGRDSLLVAGGGGGGCGHDSSPGLGGGSDIYEPTNRGASGHNGNGGGAGKLQGSDPGEDPLKVGDAGGESKGGKGGDGGRKGGGGGGGGYGGGGGGAPEFHSPGGGGGGGSFGDRIEPGIVDLTLSSGYPPTSNGEPKGIPGGAEQASDAGYGGSPEKNGADGRVVVWCTNQ